MQPGMGRNRQNHPVSNQFRQAERRLAPPWTQLQTRPGGNGCNQGHSKKSAPSRFLGRFDNASSRSFVKMLALPELPNRCQSTTWGKPSRLRRRSTAALRCRASFSYGQLCQFSPGTTEKSVWRCSIQKSRQLNRSQGFDLWSNASRPHAPTSFNGVRGHGDRVDKHLINKRVVKNLQVSTGRNGSRPSGGAALVGALERGSREVGATWGRPSRESLMERLI